MIIGVPKEIREGEYRVSVTSAGVEAFVAGGHAVRVQAGAGESAGFSDAEFRKAGATIVPTAASAWAAEMVLKVKQPEPSEFRYFRKGRILFSFLHLAPNRPLASALLKKGVTAIAYETVQEASGRLPILQPMSEIAGRMAVIVGAYFQTRPNGGRGVLISGLSGVSGAQVKILGGGTVGENAARLAAQMGAQVTVYEVNPKRIRQLRDTLPPAVGVREATHGSIEQAVVAADIVVGAAHVPGARTPRLVNRAMVSKVPAGTVLVDVAIDQGGCFETSRVTTHKQPIYQVRGVVHYCVGNMPGAYARTSTLALANATLPYALQIAQQDIPQVFEENPALARGVNCYAGEITCEAVAHSQGRRYKPLRELLG